MAAWSGALQRLRRSRPLRALIPWLPRTIREKAVRLATREVRRRAVDTSEVTAFLRPIQELQTEALARLTGREFPEWVTLYDKDTGDRSACCQEILTWQPAAGG
jgi:hypothetical protein